MPTIRQKIYTYFWLAMLTWTHENCKLILADCMRVHVIRTAALFSGEILRLRYFWCHTTDYLRSCESLWSVVTNCGSGFCKVLLLSPKAQINFPKHKLISRTKIISYLKTPTNFFKHKPISQNSNQNGLGAWLHEDQREPRKTLLARILLPKTRLWKGYGRPVRLSFATTKDLFEA